jgi:hypothetical protein
MWSGVVVALTGVCLLAVWTATWHSPVGIAGAVLLMAGGAVATSAGILYDTHGGRPLTDEIDDLRQARTHKGTKPGDMITAPRIRAHAAETSRRSDAARQASRPPTRPAFQPLGGWLLMIGAAALILAQGRYPHTPTGQHNATRSLLLAVVVALAALRIQAAQWPRRILPLLPAVAGALVVAFALLTDHDREGIVAFELVAGAWIIIAALLTLDQPRGYPPAATLPSPSAGTATTPFVREEAGVLPRLALPVASVLAAGARTRSRRRTVLALALIVIAAARGLLRRRSVRHAHASSHRVDSLRYRVPVGQDPAGVVSTLRQAGYDVRREQAPTRIQELVITRPGELGLERSTVRAAIAQAPIDLEGAPAPAHEVVFTDEPKPAPRSV